MKNIEIPKWKFPRILVLYEDDEEIYLGMRSHGYNCSGVCWSDSIRIQKKNNPNILEEIEKWYRECEEKTKNWYVPYNKYMAGELILPCDIIILNEKKQGGKYENKKQQ
jgi:hypothetical protein